MSDLESEERGEMQPAASETKEVQSSRGDDAADVKPKKPEAKSNGQKSPKKSKPTAQEESESEDEKEPAKLGVYEQPLIVEGKRQRKKTEFLTEAIDKEEQEQEQKRSEVPVPDGKGTVLGDIPYINTILTRKKTADLMILHRLLFGGAGQAQNRRRNIRKFKGFDFEKGSKEYEKKHEFASRIFIAGLKEICDVLGLERGGTKEQLQERVLEFVMMPEDKGKSLPTPKRKRKSGGQGSSTKKPRAKKPVKKKEEDEEDRSDSQSDEPDSPDEESQSEEEKSTKKAKLTPKSESKKKPTPKKQTPKREKKKEEVESESEGSDDDLPLKDSKPPSDDRIKGIVKKIIDKADLEKVTMKNVCQQVYDKFPDFDLTARKDFIKSVVKEVLRQC